ncbi:hypothetical protein SASPL_133795 [Salvia splendens]|uniref:Uncharacterized protein n=1 Tax=Salvia splendens TaxID=180675 RepID=A0A8X8ZIP3_SALSN|nr:hypothetical protein SASPL_133795 [Salvia splendens]
MITFFQVSYCLLALSKSPEVYPSSPQVHYCSYGTGASGADRAREEEVVPEAVRWSSEQFKISNAVAMKEGGESQYQPMVPNRKALLEGTPQSFQEG